MAAQAGDKPPRELAALDAGVRAAQAGDCKTSLRLIVPSLKAPALKASPAIPENIRAAVDLVG